MRILLVNTNIEDTPYPVSPLGLSMVATSLEQSGYEVRVFDGIFYKNTAASENSLTALSNELDVFQPDVIGVSVRNIDDVIMQKPTYYLDEIEDRFIGPIQQYGKGITILGGSGYSLFPFDLLKKWKFDYGIVGPGETSIIKLLRSIEDGEPVDSLPGVIKRHADNRVTGDPEIPKPKRRKTLHVPYPRIDEHLNYDPYRSHGAYPIQTKRGCALKCLYCSYPLLEGRTYQLRTANDVVDEIESVLARLPGTVFEFVDSTFNHPPGHAEDICREVIKRGLKIRLRTMGVNPSGVSPQLISLMKQAGFAQIDCTPDSASDKMLKQLRKGFNRKKLEETANILQEAEMPTMWFFVLGGPGEDEQTLEETFDFIERFIDERDLVHLTEGLRIYPKTGLETIALEEGAIQKNDSLLRPHFYVSARIGAKKLSERINEFTSKHYNCLRSVESGPSPEMISEAMKIRQKEGLNGEPMFRTLLRVRKNLFYTGN